ncbi:MAG: hypothetical protein OXE78_12795 [Gammaproteobacteria bacterium]|nr:hypothetical protein [Gammaproteobacteria bacterium]
MNKNIQFHSPAATVALISVSAILAGSHVSKPKNEIWPFFNTSSYAVAHDERTYSPLEILKSSPTRSIETSFDQKIADVYAMLTEGQESLGAEFEAIWDANVDQLYES